MINFTASLGNKPVELAEGATPLSIWLEFHSLQRTWKNTYVSRWQGPDRQSVEALIISRQADASALSAFPVGRWQMAAGGFGWTTLACSLMSWCRGASLDEVLSAWRALDATPAAETASDFAALMINPALHPGNSLSKIIRHGKDEIGVAVLLSAQTDPVVIDIPDANFGSMPMHIQKIITSRNAEASFGRK